MLSLNKPNSGNQMSGYFLVGWARRIYSEETKKKVVAFLECDGGMAWLREVLKLAPPVMVPGHQGLLGNQTHSPVWEWGHL